VSSLTTNAWPPHRTAALAVLIAFGTLSPIVGQVPPYGGAKEHVADLAARRTKTMQAIGSDAVLVLWSAPTRVYSGDVDYEYRQDSNLLYLTGIDQPDTILVLVPGAKTEKEHLFVRRPEPLRELWTGRTLTPTEVTTRSGVSKVYPQREREAFDAFMAALFAGPGGAPPTGTNPGEFAEFHAAVAAGRARLGIIRSAHRSPSGPPAAGSGEPADWVRVMEQRHPGLKAFNAADVLTSQRQIKTPYEQVVLRRSVEISAEAHVEGMRVARPGRWEYEVESAIEATFLKNGAMSWGYPSIVGSGPNATILHYLASTRQMQDGDLLLVDAAGNFQGLTGDITRTYPVNGRFSTEQRAIYEIVLEAQHAGIRAARPGGKAEEIVRAVRDVVGNGLERLGFVRAPSGPEREAEISLWMPHGPVHGIGMDVHDPLGVLDPGATFVIEPGIYIRPDALDRLADPSARSRHAERLEPLIARYRDIGIRVEDSFLMTPKGPDNLSATAPKTIEALERTVGRAR
jgi:Xaa-Pro aminopeptidase